ncbi:MAG: lysine--tRNA ligase, partial [Bdellovibrio sp.]
MSELRENPLRAEKRKKLEALRSAGIDPFPYRFDRTSNSRRIHEEFDFLNSGEKKTEAVFRLAGRVKTLRSMGKASFFNLEDQSGSLQIYIKLEELSPVAKKSFELLDLGDWVGVEGFVFRTQKGELSLHVQHFEILCKSLEPLPEKFHGVTDVEIKYRHRHLDLIADADSRRIFEMRVQIIRSIRRWMDNQGFMEVETPVLQPIYGGAAAHPFATHHRALDMKLYLKISPELYLKRLIVGGFEKVYEIGKNFRNEGIDRTHNPEFTMMEWYKAYTDYTDQMKRFEDLVCHVVQEIRGRLSFDFQGRTLDFSPPWERLSVDEALAKYAGVNSLQASEADLRSELSKRGGDPEGLNRGEILMELFELTCEEQLWNPTFILDHPEEISPLTKRHRSKPG